VAWVVFREVLVAENGVMVTDTAPFRYPHYHKPTDTPDKVDYARVARVVVGLRDVIVELVNAPVAPPQAPKKKISSKLKS